MIVWSVHSVQYIFVYKEVHYNTISIYRHRNAILNFSTSLDLVLLTIAHVLLF